MQVRDRYRSSPMANGKGLMGSIPHKPSAIGHYWIVIVALSPAVSGEL